MKHSIRMRFTCLFLTVVTAVLLAAFLLNTFGLERFYRAQKVKEIEEAYAAMRRSTNGGGENSPGLSYEDDYYELFIAEIALFIIGYIPVLGAIIYAIGGILCFIFFIIGLINAAKGQAKELPLIGGIKILK